MWGPISKLAAQTLFGLNNPSHFGSRDPPTSPQAALRSLFVWTSSWAVVLLLRNLFPLRGRLETKQDRDLRMRVHKGLWKRLVKTLHLQWIKMPNREFSSWRTKLPVHGPFGPATTHLPWPNVLLQWDKILEEIKSSAFVTFLPFYFKCSNKQKA